MADLNCIYSIPTGIALISISIYLNMLHAVISKCIPLYQDSLTNCNIVITIRRFPFILFYLKILMSLEISKKHTVGKCIFVYDIKIAYHIYVIE